MQYRITKKYYREQETAEVKYHYIIEESKVSLFKSILNFRKTLTWISYEEFNYNPMGGYYTPKRFSSLVKAKKFLRNLQEPILPDEH